MEPTAFKQVADNAISSTLTDLSEAGVTSIVLALGGGAKFPQPGNGFYLTLWDNIAYPNAPGSDPNMEKVLCTSRSGDALTVSATTRPHSNPCAVALLDVAQNTTDLQEAVNNLEQKMTYSQSFNLALEVEVMHNLGRRPAVTVIDSAGDECEAAVEHVNDNECVISFSGEFSGVVICN